MTNKDFQVEKEWKEILSPENLEFCVTKEQGIHTGKYNFLKTGYITVKDVNTPV